MPSLFKQSTIRRLMKKELPKETILSGDGAMAMLDLLETVFFEVMKNVKTQPYRTITGYMVGKECQKYLVKQSAFEKQLRALTDIKERVEKEIQLPDKI